MCFCKIREAFVCSVAGIDDLLKERAFIQEIILGLVLLGIFYFSKNSPLEKLYIFSAYCLILITEAINTGIETVVNRISLEKHPESKKAKDIGSAAVFLAIIHFTVVSVFIVSSSFGK